MPEKTRKSFVFAITRSRAAFSFTSAAAAGRSFSGRVERSGLRFFVLHERVAIGGVRDGFPSSVGCPHFESILGCETVGELAVAVASPHNAFNTFDFRKRDGEGSGADGVRHPGACVAVDAIVHESEFVAVGADAASGGGGSCAGG